MQCQTLFSEKKNKKKKYFKMSSAEFFFFAGQLPGVFIISVNI